MYMDHLHHSLSIYDINRPQEDPFEDIPLFDLEAPVTIETNIAQ